MPRPANIAQNQGITLNTVSDVVAIPTQTLNRWHEQHPQLFKILVLGCVAFLTRNPVKMRAKSKSRRKPRAKIANTRPTGQPDIAELALTPGLKVPLRGQGRYHDPEFK